MAVTMAQDKKVTGERGEMTELPTASSNGVELSGTISEARAIYEEDGSSIDQILLAVSWTVGGTKWNNGTWVQTYMQWEDPQEPGNY